MYKKIALKASHTLIRLNIVKKSEIDVYTYGFELLISTFMSVTVILFLSIFFNAFKDTCYFLIGFIVTRLICGGFHAKKNLTCFLTTLFNYAFFLFVVLSLNKDFENYIMLVGTIVSCSFILFFSPCANQNNPMSEYRKKQNKKYGFVLILFLIFFLSYTLITRNIPYYYLSFLIGVFSVSTSLLIAKIQTLFNKRRSENEKNS